MACANIGVATATKILEADPGKKYHIEDLRERVFFAVLDSCLATDPCGPQSALRQALDAARCFEWVGE